MKCNLDARAASLSLTGKSSVRRPKDLLSECICFNITWHTSDRTGSATIGESITCADLGSLSHAGQALTARKNINSLCRLVL
ncbi:hypothetical protein E2C01_087180 [Portunus trituberculatus]|uniref:Uncharacterized protein n=1 Tax=Portunus trituberculatus TaxID=210409 RepID=A0A5B7JGL7_PORTR|nr:hypothetical protein [Portunus trituberculatus]